MADAASLSPSSFGLVATFLRADWIVKGVMLALIMASIASWAVIIDKAIKFTRLKTEANRFEHQIASGKPLEDIANEAGAATHALGAMLQSALREWKEARARGPLSDGQGSVLIQRIDRTLDGHIAREMRAVEEGLGLLAIVATASPFIGLFGTVWGIMTAFQAIAVQKNTSLAVVAPAIAQALFATAVGLAAAIPAYIAYNALSTWATRYGARLETFADDLTGAVLRRLGGG
jgi:biopolymer transport protein TolQ